MLFNEKPPQFMTSAELEEAVRIHREQTKKLIKEIKIDEIMKRLVRL